MVCGAVSGAVCGALPQAGLSPTAEGRVEQGKDRGSLGVTR